MVGYDCARCGFTTKIRCIYVRHLKRKTSCHPTRRNVPVAELLRQLEEKPPRKTGPKYEQFDKRFDQLQKQIDAINDTLRQQTHSAGPTTQVYLFGQEYHGHIDASYFSTALEANSGPAEAVSLTQRLIDDVFFNRLLPQNWTFRETTVHQNFGVWVERPPEQITRAVVERCMDIVEQTFQGTSLPRSLFALLLSYYNDTDGVADALVKHTEAKMRQMAPLWAQQQQLPVHSHVMTRVAT